MSSWSRAFEKVKPGEEPPGAPEELKTWSRQTMCGLVGGMFFGGYRGLLKSRTSEPAPSPANSAAHRAAMFVVRDGIFTGTRIGLFVSMFSALALISHGIVGREHPVNFAASGAITCGLFGSAMAGVRRGGLPAAVLGGAMSGAAAFAQQVLQESASQGMAQDEGNADNAKDDTLSDDEAVKRRIDQLIYRFEASLEQFPTRSDKDEENNDEGSEASR